MEDTKKTYAIGGKTFTQEPLVWGQEIWLRDLVFGGQGLRRLDHAAIIDLLKTKGPMLLAVLLIEEGQTRAQKVEGGGEGVRRLADWFMANTASVAVMEPVTDFFALNGRANLWQLVQMEDLTATPQETVAATGLLTPSSP